LELSFVPRIHGLGGVGKVDAVGEVLGQEVVGHLRALVPGQGLPGEGGHPVKDRQQRGMQVFGAVPVGQVHQPQEAGPPVGQGADRRGAHPAHDEIALPVSDPGTCLDHGRAGVDQQARGEEERGARHRAASAFAQRPGGAQLLGQRPAQVALSGVVERLIDGLVAQVPVRPIRIALAQVRGDLGRAPLQLELVLHNLSEPGSRLSSGRRSRRTRPRARACARSSS
jgi:hypothetical protein